MYWCPFIHLISKDIEFQLSIWKIQKNCSQNNLLLFWFVNLAQLLPFQNSKLFQILNDNFKKGLPSVISMSQIICNYRLSLGLNNIKLLTQGCECEFEIAFVSLCCLYGNKKRSVQMKIYSKSSLMRCLDNKLSGYGITFESCILLHNKLNNPLYLKIVLNAVM